MKGRTTAGRNLVAFENHGAKDRGGGANEIQFIFKSVYFRAGLTRQVPSIKPTQRHK